LKNEVKSAALIATHKKISAARTDSGVMLTVPATAPDKIATTIALNVKGALRVE
jgi:hypothetical protein